MPSLRPSIVPSYKPSSNPSGFPTGFPSSEPSYKPTSSPTSLTNSPSTSPTDELAEKGATDAVSGITLNIDFGDIFIVAIALFLSILLSSYYNWLVIFLVTKLELTLAPLSRSSRVLALPLSLITLASNVVFVRQLLRDESYYIALGVIAVRVVLIIFGLYMVRCVYSKSSLAEFLDPRVDNPFKIFKCLICGVMLFDPTALRTIPWRMDKFSKKSNGFPTLWAYVWTNIIMLVFAVVVLGFCVASLFATNKPRSWQLLFTAFMCMIYITYILYVYWVRVIQEEIQTINTLGSVNINDTNANPDVELGDVHVTEDLDMDDIFAQGAENEKKKASGSFGFSRGYSSGSFETKSGSFDAANAKQNESVGGSGAGGGTNMILSFALREVLDEISMIYDRVVEGRSYDEPRLDHLYEVIASSPKLNPEYKQFISIWRFQASVFTTNCFEVMRGYVPPRLVRNNGDCSVESLIKDGLSATLSKRIVAKTSLWLICSDKEEIGAMDEQGLYGRHNPFVQALDMTELGALYHVTRDVVFKADPTGSKYKWKLTIEGMLQRLMEKRDQGELTEPMARNPAYNGQQPVYAKGASSVARKKFSFR